VAVLLVAFACSCTAAQARRAHTGGAIALSSGLFGILGAITAAELVPSHSSAATGAGIVFVPVVVLGALMYAATDSTVNGDHEPVMTARERAFAAAYELAREAKHAARRGDCAEVQAIEPRVRELDEVVYRKFLHDEIIRTCLGVQVPAPAE
jgi:hypothetical protein